MVILFLLGALQAVIGWIMVASGLVPEKYFVGHVELATHFIAALGLLCYTLWFALSLLIKPKQIVINAPLQKMMLAIIIILFFQLIYGAFMAGLKAAVSAPTWPSINGSMVPAAMNELSPWAKNLVSNNIMVHFIHRGLAYVLFILITVWYFKAGVIKKNRLFGKLRFRLLILVTLQLVLGIFTVLKSTQPNGLLLFGVLHQFIAMLLVMCIITLLYLLRKKSVI